MTFLKALKRAAALGRSEVTIYRNNGPEFVIDRLGQVRLRADCLYVGDMLDLHDWRIGNFSTEDRYNGVCSGS